MVYKGKPIAPLQKMVQALGAVSLKVFNPSCLFVEAASYLALQTTQPDFPKMFDYLDSLTETLV